jgi:hypothetical protein
MLTLSYSADLWLCACIEENETVISCLFRKQSKLLSLCASDGLGTVAFGLRLQATVLKSSPAPWVNSFDCSLNRHDITVYYFISVLNSTFSLV